MSNRTMSEVVAEFNKLSGQNVKRFVTVEIGEKRLNALKIAQAAAPEVAKKAQAKGAKNAQAVVPDAAKKANPSPAPAKVAKRLPGECLHRITVDGVPYRSVATAFTALNLPMDRHIKFRGKLKASGKEVFEHEGKQYKFVSLS